MNKLVIACVLAAMMTAGSAYAKGGVGNRGHASGTSRTRNVQKGGKALKKNTAAKLKALDTNGDKAIDRSEASRKLERRFEKIDTNGNSQLSVEELKALKKTERVDHAATSPSTATPQTEN